MFLFVFLAKLFPQLCTWSWKRLLTTKMSQFTVMNETRMHSSRMRTGRSLTVCWCLLRGGCLLLGGVCSGGCLLPGGCLLWGGLLWGVSALGGVCIPACTEADPPCVQNSWHTLVKILPWPNFVAAGNYEWHCDLFSEVWMTKGHNQGIINDKRSQFGFVNGIMNYKKGHDNVEDIFTHKPESLLIE